MSESGFESRAALAGVAAGGVRLTPLPEGRAALLLGRAGGPAPDVAEARRIAPGQWFVTGEAADAVALAARLPDFAVVDQGHGRVGIAVAGPMAAAMLAKGTAVDLDAMAAGETASTMLGPISVTLTRLGAEAFEVHVGRSFAASLWEEMRAMAKEF